MHIIMIENKSIKLIRSKLISFFLGLILVFNAILPLTSVFAEDVSPPTAPVTSWQLLDLENQAVSEENPVEVEGAYALRAEVHLQALKGLKLRAGDVYQLALPENSEIGAWSAEQIAPKDVVNKLGEVIGSFVIQDQGILLTLNEAATDFDQIDAVIQTDAVLTTDVDKAVIQEVQVGDSVQNIAFVGLQPDLDLASTLNEEEIDKTPAQSIENVTKTRQVRALPSERSVATLAEFDQALADENVTKIILTADITLDATKEIATGRTLTITSDGNVPHQVTITPSARHFKLLQGANLTLENLVIEGQNKPGGVRVDSSSAERSSLTITNTTFQNCKSAQANTGVNFGGAIDVYDSTVGPIGYATVLIKGTSAFLNNQAYYGGAIAARNAWITIEGETNFSGNMVVGDGWGGSTLFFQNVESEIKDKVTFTGNGTTGKEGGALMLYGGGNAVISGNVTFESNKASNGGAIMSRGGNTTSALEINGDIKFKNNSASAQGGAIHTQARTVNIATDGTSNVEFLINTSSQYGGAVEATDVTLEIGAGTIFDGNKALYSNSGGAVHVYSTGATVKFNVTGTATRHVIFRNNSAASCGGALCIHGGNAASTSVIKYADIVNNYSRNFGGGIDIDQARFVTLENCLIQGNTSSTDGGGIAMEDAHVDLVIRNSIIDNNSAGGYPHSANYRVTTSGGGGISFDLGTITISDSSITNNSAPVNGGGIGYRNHANQASLLAAVKTTNTIFLGNTAKTLTAISETDKITHADKINKSEVGKTYSQNQAYAYNNFDIQYSGTNVPLPKVTVTFDTKGGTPVPNSQTVDYGQGVYLPTPEPTRPFSQFLGWVTANGDIWSFATAGNPNTGAPVRSDMTLYARWQSDEFKIDYDLDNGTNDINNPTSYVYGVGVTSFADPVRDNYQFLGWFDAPSGGNLITSISDTDDGDKILYANWKANDFVINYSLDGGSNHATNPTTYTYGIGVTSFGDASKTGYKFLGWYDAESGGNAVTNITDTATGTQTLYARFEKDLTRIDVKPIEKRIIKGSTYSWQHTHHEPVLYDENGVAVDGAKLWAIIDGKVYDENSFEELPEGVYDVTFTNVNPLTKAMPFKSLLGRALIKEVTAQTTATIIAEDATIETKDPAPITVRYVDQNGKEIKTATVYTGKNGDVISSAAPMIDGYELISLSDKINAVITDQAQTFTFVYKPVNSVQQALPTTGGTLPRTGEMENGWHLMVGFLLVALLSFLSWIKIGKRFIRKQG